MNNCNCFFACSANVLTLWALLFWYFPYGRGDCQSFTGLWRWKYWWWSCWWSVATLVWRKSLKRQSWQTGQRAKECERKGNLTTFTTVLSKTDDREKTSQWETLSYPWIFPKICSPSIQRTTVCRLLHYSISTVVCGMKELYVKGRCWVPLVAAEISGNN